MIDYRDLLRRYIEHVGDEEGTDFLGRSAEFSGKFTHDELAVLRDLSDGSIDQCPTCGRYGYTEQRGVCDCLCHDQVEPGDPGPPRTERLA